MAPFLAHSLTHEFIVDFDSGIQVENEMGNRRKACRVLYKRRRGMPDPWVIYDNEPYTYVFRQDLIFDIELERDKDSDLPQGLRPKIRGERG